MKPVPNQNTRPILESRVLDQTRAVDKSRLVKKLGVIGPNTRKELCTCLQEMFTY